jgi:hypothetical protein
VRECEKERERVRNRQERERERDTHGDIQVCERVGQVEVCRDRE